MNKTSISDNKIPLEIVGVYLHPTHQVPIVFLATEGEKVVLSVIIGFLEAQAILLAWKNIKPIRPLTADLLKSVIMEDFKAKIDEVVIDDLVNGTYLARIEILDKEGRKISRDARPSDAIALALRAAAPIKISSNLLAKTKSEQENTKAMLDFIRKEISSEDMEDLFKDLL